MPHCHCKTRPVVAWLLSVYILITTSLVGTAEAGQTDRLLKRIPMPDSWNLPAKAINTKKLPYFALDKNAENDDLLPVYQIAPDTYFLFGSIATLDQSNRGWNGNAGFVITREGVVVIDSLGTPKLGNRMIATIRSMTERPIKYLIITHNHPDHAYGAAAFQRIDGIKVIAHKGTLEYNNSSTMEASVNYRKEILPEDMKDFQPVTADAYLGNREFEKYTVKLGDSVFEIYNTGRHHSYGDLVVYQKKENIVWISDLAFNQRTTYMGDGDSKQILEAQQWLMKTFPDASLMVPGHGAPQTKPFPMVKKTNDYVKRLRKEMMEAVENGVSLYDAVQNSEFPDWKDSRLYEENHRANANFVYREMEKEYFENF